MDFFPLRLNWQRLEAFMSSPQSGKCNLQAAAVAIFAAKMRRVVARTEFVDALPERIARVAISPAFWLKASFLEVFKSSLDFSSSSAAPKHSMSFVRQVSSPANADAADALHVCG